MNIHVLDKMNTIYIMLTHLMQIFKCHVADVFK